jgi:hypothetical protein
MIRPLVLATALALIACSVARAQSGDQPAVLGGPAIAETPAHATLVARDFNGSVRRPETTPEEAALSLLNLPEEARKGALAIFQRRAAVIDKFVSENLDLLNKLGTSSGNKLEQFALGMEAFQKLEKVWSGGPLWEQVKAALPEEPAKKFDALMREYWDALIEEGKKTPNEEGKKRGRFEVVVAERAQIFFKEVEHSFTRQAESGMLFVTYLTQDLDLTESQKQRVRQMSLEFARKYGTKPTEEEQKFLFLDVVSILDEKQREKFMKKVTGG